MAKSRAAAKKAVKKGTLDDEIHQRTVVALAKKRLPDAAWDFVSGAENETDDHPQPPCSSMRLALRPRGTSRRQCRDDVSRTKATFARVARADRGEI